MSRTVDNRERTVNICTAGICMKSQGPGGYAAVMFRGEQLNHASYKVIQGGLMETGSSEVTLWPIVQSLDWMRANEHIFPQPLQIVVYPDDPSIPLIVNNGWLCNWESNDWQPVKNVDLWHRISRTLLWPLNIRFEWLPADKQNPGVELVEKIARTQAREHALLQDQGTNSATSGPIETTG